MRGLGERYSNTSLNGSRLPTTEVDKKVVPLDLFPARLLEKVNVSKTYSPDRPGDFAAGLVELETRDFPAEPTLEVTIGCRVRLADTTGEAFGEYAGGLSFGGGGGQPIPGGIPGDRLTRYSPFTGVGYTPAELETFGESFVGQWTPPGTSPAWDGSGFDSAPYANNLALSATAPPSASSAWSSPAPTPAATTQRDENRQVVHHSGAAATCRSQNDYDLTATKRASVAAWSATSRFARRSTTPSSCARSRPATPGPRAASSRAGTTTSPPTSATTG